MQTFKDRLARFGLHSRERLAGLTTLLQLPASTRERSSTSPAEARAAAPAVKDARPARLLEVFELSPKVQGLVRERERRGGLREPLRLAVRILASHRLFTEDELVAVLDARRGWFGVFFELARLGDRHAIWDRLEVRDGGCGYGGLLWKAMQVEQPQLTLAMDMAEFIGENGLERYREAVALVEQWTSVRTGSLAPPGPTDDSTGADGECPAAVQEGKGRVSVALRLVDGAAFSAAPSSPSRAAAPAAGDESLVAALCDLNVNQWMDAATRPQTDGWYDGQQLFLKRMAVEPELYERLQAAGLVMSLVGKIVGGPKGTFTILAGTAKWRDTYAIDVTALRRLAGEHMLRLDQTWRGGNAVEYKPLQLLGSTGQRVMPGRGERLADAGEGPDPTPSAPRSGAAEVKRAPIPTAAEPPSAAPDAPPLPRVVGNGAVGGAGGADVGAENPTMARLRAMVRGAKPPTPAGPETPDGARASKGIDEPVVGKVMEEVGR